MCHSQGSGVGGWPGGRGGCRLDSGGHGLSVAEFESYGPVRITALQRGGRVRIPDEREVLQRGDIVTAAVGPASARALAHLVHDLEREDVLGEDSDGPERGKV